VLQAYSKRAAGNKRRLALAAPGAFKQSMGICLKGQKTAAPGLIKFVAELLRMPLGQQQPGVCVSELPAWS
jgi:hypothetical protein